MSLDEMDQRCGQTLHGLISGQVHFSFDPRYPRCKLFLDSGENNWKIAFYFTEFNTMEGCVPGGTEVTIYQTIPDYSDISYDTVEGFSKRLCGSAPNIINETFFTYAHYLVVDFYTPKNIVRSRFTFFYNLYQIGSMCGRSEYTCDNGRCIRQEQNCNGHDPCGDGSDCRIPSHTGLSGGQIAGIVVGVLVFLTLVCALQYLSGIQKNVSRCREKWRLGREERRQEQWREGNLNLPVTTTTNPVTPSSPETTAVADSADLRVHLPDPSSSSPPSYRSLASVTQNGHGPANTRDRHSHSHIPRHSPRHSPRRSPSHAVDEDNACHEEPPPTYNKAIEHSDLYNVRGHSAYI